MENRAVLTFALPEDQESDRIAVLVSDTKDGTYEVDQVYDYQYGVTELIHRELDTTKWYAIQFFNTDTDFTSAVSDPVYGGTFSHSAPFLAVSSTADGAQYATIEDLYSISGLTPADVDVDVAANSLRQARAVIDYRMAEVDIDRFNQIESKIARRKYNATLRIVKEAEINIALGNVYTNMCDDLIIKNMREGEGSSAGGVSIGDTTVSGDSLAERSENIAFLAALADRYFSVGDRLLASLDTPSVRLIGYDTYSRPPKFKYPFHGM